jgi:hypothetical protein
VARLRTLDQIVDEARIRADQVGSQAVSTAQAYLLVNQRLAELWELLTVADPDRYHVSATIDTVPGELEYELPDDFMQIRLVSKIIGTQRVTIEPFRVQELNRVRNSLVYDPVLGAPAVRYRVMGQGLDGSATRLRFEPDPGTGSFEVWYVQAPQLLVEGEDVFDGVGGWESYISVAVAIDMKFKTEEETAPLERQLAEYRRRIMSMSRLRDQGRAPVIADVRSGGSWFPRAR